MKRHWIVGCLLLLANPVMGQGIPSTDIFVADISYQQATLTLGKLKNITRREGYDNQPHFLPGERGMLYTSQLGEQTDIMLYDFSTATAKNLSNSPESEYSPTLMPNSSEYSVIHAVDGKQELWAYSLSDGSRRPLIQPNYLIGYHAWLTPKQVLITVLDGDSMNLQIANLDAATSHMLSPQSGASLFRIPGTDDMSFNQVVDGEHWLMKVSPVSGEVIKLVRLPDDAGYYTWAPDGTVLVASEGKIWQWDLRLPKVPLQSVADIVEACPGGVSRLAVNDAMTRLAVVCHH